MGRAPNPGGPQRVSAHVVPKAKPIPDHEEEEKTTIESQWEEEASTTVEQGEVADKIRELEARLRQAGFRRQAAKGSHRKWIHPSGKLVIMSGSEGDDAKRYQENQVDEAVAAITKPSKPR